MVDRCTTFTKLVKYIEHQEGQNEEQKDNTRAHNWALQAKRADYSPRYKNVLLSVSCTQTSYNSPLLSPRASASCSQMNTAMFSVVLWERKGRDQGNR